MGLLERFRDRVVASRVRSRARRMARDLFIATVRMRHSSRVAAPTGLACGRWVLGGRPGWRQVDDYAFCYEETGGILEFPDTMSLTDLIEQVVGYETSSSLLRDGHDAHEAAELVPLARQEARDRILK